MKKLILLLSISSLTFAFEYGLSAKKISDGIYCFFGKLEPITKENSGNMVNTCYADMGGSYVVIDSGPTYLYAKEAHSIIKKIADKKIDYVINTHAHDDHHLGNIYYSNLGIKIVGSKDIKKHFKNLEQTRMERMISKEAYSGTKLKLPDIEVNKTLELKGLIIKNLSIAHTDTDIVIYYPKKRVLFVGDLIFTGRLLRLGSSGDLRGWIRAIEEVEKFDVDFIISGHGFDVDNKNFVTTKKYLIDLKNEVKSALEDGVELNEITKIVKLQKYKNLKMFEELNGGNIYRAYQLLEWEE